MAICHTISMHKQSFISKVKALATKCILNYSQMLDNFTRLVLKTAEKLFVPSVWVKRPRKDSLSLSFSV